MRIQLITRGNGAGLSRDLELLDAALRDLGHQVAHIRLHRRALMRHLHVFGRRFGAEAKPADLNIFLERIDPLYFSAARRNVLIPNPEWFDPGQRRFLAGFDGVFVKTRHAQALFGELGGKVVYTGFTSRDNFRADISRERKFLHVAGRSMNKGTEMLLDSWTEHPDWPPLTVLWRARQARMPSPAPNIVFHQDQVSDEELVVLQNTHRFHICPSETEGFGHYLVEALGVGAIALTLDAPPMNEMVAPERGILLPASAKGRQGLATTYGYTEEALGAAVASALSLSEAQIAALSGAARRWFNDNASGFVRRLEAALVRFEPDRE